VYEVIWWVVVLLIIIMEWHGALIKVTFSKRNALLFKAKEFGDSV
jgi:hypothetical protein